MNNNTQSQKNLGRPQLQSAGGNQSKSNISRISSLYQIKNAREKYTQNQSKLESRLLDNHIHEPHANPWKAIGITPPYKYDFNDSGLGFIVKDKYQIKLNETRAKVKEQREKEDVRFYPEFKNVKDRDVIVVIEYCNDCQNHQGTTKHDEEQYIRLANNYKILILKHFPVAKVFLKPVRVDQNASSIQNIYSRQRIGAFEIYVMSKTQGEPKKGCIHSKLKTGKWPSSAQVLNLLCQYMITCTVSIQLTLCDFDLADIPEDELLTKKNKLHEIQVIMRPYREKQQSIGSHNNLTLNTNNMSQTRISRPVSGISRRSDSDSKFFQNNTSLFGEDIPKKNECFQGKTNKHGLVIFEQIPSDVYIVEVKETNNFKSLRETINIFELMQNQQGLDLHFELQHFNLTFLTITASYKSLKDQKIDHLKNALIKIYQYDEKDQINVDPIVEEGFDGTFQIQLEPGQYMIKIEKDGHQTIEQQYYAQPGQQTLDFPPVTKYIDDEPKKELDNKTRFQNRPSSSARKGILKSSESQQSKINGKQQEPNQSGEESLVNQNTSPQVASVKIQEQQNNNNTRFSNGSLNNNQSASESPKQSQKQHARPPSSNPAKKSSQENSIQQQQISSPEKFNDELSFNKIEKLKQADKAQLKPPKKSSEIKLTGFCSQNIIQFSVFTPDNESVQENSDNIIVQNEISNSKIGLWIQESKKYTSGVYRIYAKILNNKLFNSNNLKVYASSQASTTFLQIPSIENADLSQQLYWDIGVFDVKLQKFFEINNYTNQPITRDYLLEQFEGLLNYLSASRGEIKKILGFDNQDKQVFDDDVYVKKESVLKSLENYEFEGSSQIGHFIQSASNNKGYLSFKKLEQKLIHKDIEQNCYRFVDSSFKVKYDEDEEDEKYQEDYDDI
ncbi:Rdx family protein (macronuclear) [Tetrahymena thermophila SB210]|uniref:Rdx family protein n=1 Tax=Tetrahymena thermophila (strain SB210) TaxID=312017 RepID=Q24D45_TETTS|nr:Rdx family protein [Tetrahymena thermophila SB210]EAS05696.2 Rdx family protein [Tetrahymena thermophila SB210]|eukprot:XP_001025941.2 Rdx family protein [Tetrahymena thermophila SB210]